MTTTCKRFDPCSLYQICQNDQVLLDFLMYDIQSFVASLTLLREG